MKPYYKKDGITIYCGDCLEVMPCLNVKVDSIMVDLPYGTTACDWDKIIPLDTLWKQYKQVIRSNGAIVLFGIQPFTTVLINSNMKIFKYCWIWNKKKGGNPLISKLQPIRITEDIIIFSYGVIPYYPQMTIRNKLKRRRGNRGKISQTTNNAFVEDVVYFERYPKNIISMSNAYQYNKFHPTQKPVDLMAYLIRTYTNKGDLILDNTMGSGTTLVAAKQEERRAIGIEIEEEYCKIAIERLENPGITRKEMNSPIRSVKLF